MSRWVWLARTTVWLAMASAALAALYGGLVLRQWLWVSTPGVLRFPSDINNAWNHGSEIVAAARKIHLARGNPDPDLTWNEFFDAYRDA